jgi:hypothetical protein
MKINVDKTKLLAISDALSYQAECYIQTESGETLTSVREPIKVLGFTFDQRPSAAAHVDAMLKKARRRFWVLRHLRRFGFDEDELLLVYKSLVRSVLDFCAVVYHSLLTQDMSAAIERVQSQSLKIIYGFGKSYNELLVKTGLTTLEERRLKSIDKFTSKCLEGRFEGWFPRSEARRSGRNPRPYHEAYARCDRLKNSPLYFMRRRLNDNYSVV